MTWFIEVDLIFSHSSDNIAPKSAHRPTHPFTQSGRWKDRSLSLSHSTLHAVLYSVVTCEERPAVSWIFLYLYEPVQQRRAAVYSWSQGGVTFHSTFILGPSSLQAFLFSKGGWTDYDHQAHNKTSPHWMKWMLGVWTCLQETSCKKDYFPGAFRMLD